MAKDTARTCVQYLSTGRGEKYLNHREKIYHRMLLCEKI